MTRLRTLQQGIIKLYSSGLLAKEMCLVVFAILQRNTKDKWTGSFMIEKKQKHSLIVSRFHSLHSKKTNEEGI